MRKSSQPAVPLDFYSNKKTSLKLKHINSAKVFQVKPPERKIITETDLYGNSGPYLSK